MVEKHVKMVSGPSSHKIQRQTIAMDLVNLTPNKVLVSPPEPCCHTNIKRQMYGSQSTQALLSYKQETNVW